MIVLSIEVAIGEDSNKQHQHLKTTTRDIYKSDVALT